MSARSLLLVDDDQVFNERLARAFERRGYEVRAAGDGAEALEMATEDSPELAVVDLRMPGDGGLDLVAKLHSLDPTTRIVVLTGYGSIATALEAMRRGAIDYLSKPADADQIERALLRDEGPTEEPPEPGEVPSLARIEREHIERVLVECGGNISQAARLLGLHRRSLQRKLSKYPVTR